MQFAQTSHRPGFIRITLLALIVMASVFQAQDLQANIAHAAQASAATLPAQVINLADWKLTLPLGAAKKPTEIKQPQLATYQLDPWFMASGGGVRFRAPVNGVTTSGSSYPRTELREMTNAGKSNAAWSSTSGTHTMIVDEAITAVPQVKKKLITAQIHDAKEDLLTVKLNYPELYLDAQGKKVYMLDANYTLGKRFTVKIVSSGGQTKVYYNGSANPVYIMKKSFSGAYFKAGTYLQSNCSIEGSALCNANNYGEVMIYNVTVSHQ